MLIMEPNTTTRIETEQDLHDWAESLECEVRRDLGNDEEEIQWWYWIETIGDRSVGIFPVTVSKEFLSVQELIDWSNLNRSKVEQLILGDRWDEDLENSLTGRMILG